MTITYHTWYLGVKAVNRAVDMFEKRIIEWYKKHGRRELPWRCTRDPWAVLVAAVMLRRTTTKQVLQVYNEFTKRYSQPELLLNASLAEIELLIKPLGLRHRARQLIELANYIVKKLEGKIPCSREELKKLPGIGDYAVSEILLVYCDESVPLLDTNTVRLLFRVFGVKPAKSLPYRDSKYHEFVKCLVPKDPELAKYFNYGVLDFAREVCTAKRPRCTVCILNDICIYAKFEPGGYQLCKQR